MQLDCTTDGSGAEDGYTYLDGEYSDNERTFPLERVEPRHEHVA